MKYSEYEGRLDVAYQQGFAAASRIMYTHADLIAFGERVKEAYHRATMNGDPIPDLESLIEKK